MCVSFQVVRGGDYVSLDFSLDAVFRVPPNGTALVADFNAATLFRIANAGGITPVATSLRGPIRVVMDRNGWFDRRLTSHAQM